MTANVRSQPTSEGDEIRVRLLLGTCGLLLLAVVVMTAWLAGQLSGLLRHGTWPDTPIGDAPVIVARWPIHGSDPAGAWPGSGRGDVAGPAWVYPILLVLVAGLAAVLWWAARRLRDRPGAKQRPGFATVKDIDALLSPDALRKKAATIRPSLRDKPPLADLHQAGFSLGRQEATRRELWGHLEWSGLLVAAERMGKTMLHIVPRILDAPGAVITTSTRLDTFALTYAARARKGPVFVFDPQEISQNVPRMRWSPVAGAQDPLVAIQRAAGFVAGSRVAGKNTENGDYFAGMATAVVRAYLHAAALGGHTMRSVLQWSMNPKDVTPLGILRGNPKAAPLWADELASQANGDPRQVGNVWSVVRRAFDSFADPRVLASCDVPADDAFDVGDFIDRRGTLYIVGSRDSQTSVAPLIAALIEDIVRGGQQRAQRSRGSRLDPPMSLILDECTNIAPIPSLPSLMSDGGGKGIPVLAAMQSRYQARGLWGDDGAAAMWDTCSYKLILGGLSDANDLGAISDLAGEVDDYAGTHSHSMNSSTYSQNLRRIKVLERSDIRQLPFGRALLLTRNLPPVLTDLVPWWERDDAAALKAEEAKTFAMMDMEPT